MHKIDVFFTGPTPNVTVAEDPAGVHAGDDIFWDFHSTDPAIKWAEIEFQGGAQFFRARVGASANKRGTDLVGGHGYIVGKAPEVPGRPLTGATREDKYTVIGSSAQGASALRSKDPVIITCDP